MRRLPILFPILFFLGIFPLQAQAAEPDPPDLTGKWLKEWTLTSTYRIARIARFTTTATTYLLVDIDQDGARLTMETEVCALVMTNSAPGFQPIVPDAFIESLPQADRRATLTRNGTSWQITSPAVWNIQGVTLDDPGRDPMPDDPNDPRVVDQESDGHPGFTIEIEGPFGGSLFLARRSWDSFTGRIYPDSIRGSVQWGADEVVLDATRRILRNSPETTPDPDRSSFLMIPIAPHTTCQHLPDDPSRLFP